jgi:hypothetical protein
MANKEHIALLKQGVGVWNKWRQKTPNIKADLTTASLPKADLTGADLSGADLSGAILIEANLTGANLTGANLYWACLRGANLIDANLTGANLTGAYFGGAQRTVTYSYLNGPELTVTYLGRANLIQANLSGAKLPGADLSCATLVEADLTNADLTSCYIYGISAWGLKLNRETKQQNLIITKKNEPEITVDNIEVAQFVYLLLHNEKIRRVIDTIGKKGVLLLGRFTDGRINVLNRLREELRNRGFVPIVFNFERPDKSDFTETLMTLTGLCRFVIADITKPKSTPFELKSVVPEYMVPFVPIIEEGEDPFSMFQNLWTKYELWVFRPISYSSVEELIQILEVGIINPALVRFDELVEKKAKELQVTRAKDIISGTFSSAD